MDHLLGVQAAVAQPPFQGLLVRREDKDADRVLNFALDLRCPLHVNIEQQVPAALKGLLQEALGGAVVVAEHVGVFQELAACNHLLEILNGHKEILAPVLLAAARSAGGVGDGEVQVRHPLSQLVYKRGLARARRRGNDVHGAHSMFWTCSRDFSISAFMASPSCVMRRASPATPVVLESRVLASRFISCSRKSSFLPTSPPLSSSPRKCWMWVLSRTSSS